MIDETGPIFIVAPNIGTKKQTSCKVMQFQCGLIMYSMNIIIKRIFKPFTTAWVM